MPEFDQSKLRQFVDPTLSPGFKVPGKPTADEPDDRPDDAWPVWGYAVGNQVRLIWVSVGALLGYVAVALPYSLWIGEAVANRNLRLLCTLPINVAVPLLVFAIKGHNVRISFEVKTVGGYQVSIPPHNIIWNAALEWRGTMAAQLEGNRIVVRDPEDKMLGIARFADPPEGYSYGQMFLGQQRVALRFDPDLTDEQLEAVLTRLLTHDVFQKPGRRREFRLSLTEGV